MPKKKSPNGRKKAAEDSRGGLSGPDFNPSSPIASDVSFITPSTTKPPLTAPAPSLTLASTPVSISPEEGAFAASITIPRQQLQDLMKVVRLSQTQATDALEQAERMQGMFLEATEKIKVLTDENRALRETVTKRAHECNGVDLGFDTIENSSFTESIEDLKMEGSETVEDEIYQEGDNNTIIKSGNDRGENVLVLTSPKTSSNSKGIKSKLTLAREGIVAAIETSINSKHLKVTAGSKLSLDLLEEAANLCSKSFLILQEPPYHVSASSSGSIHRVTKESLRKHVISLHGVSLASAKCRELDIILQSLGTHSVSCFGYAYVLVLSRANRNAKVITAIFPKCHEIMNN